MLAKTRDLVPPSGRNIEQVACRDIAEHRACFREPRELLTLRWSEIGPGCGWQLAKMLPALGGLIVMDLARWLDCHEFPVRVQIWRIVRAKKLQSLLTLYQGIYVVMVVWQR